MNLYLLRFNGKGIGSEASGFEYGYKFGGGFGDGSGDGSLYGAGYGSGGSSGGEWGINGKYGDGRGIGFGNGRGARFGVLDLWHFLHQSGVGYAYHLNLMQGEEGYDNINFLKQYKYY